MDDELIRIPFHEWHGLTIARRTAHRARDIPWSVTLARQREANFAGHLALADRTRDHARRLLSDAPVQTLDRPSVAGAVALAHAAAATR